MTVKKRAAWKPACDSFEPWRRKVQWRLSRKLLLTATTNAPTAASRWFDVGALGEQREDDEVDDVAAAADDGEVEELDPVARLLGAEVDAADDPPRPAGSGLPASSGRRAPRLPLLSGGRSAPPES